MHDRDVAFLWLVRTRWAATFAFAAGIVVAQEVLHVPLRLPPLVTLWSLAVATNALAAWIPKPREEQAATGLLLFDIVSLTAMLAITGGPANPFNALYLVYITLAAMTLSGRVTASLTALAIIAYGLLFALEPLGLARWLGGAGPHAAHGGGAAHAMHTGGTPYSAHLYGMFLAFSTTAVLTAVFVGRLAAALREREVELHDARVRVERGERLAALSTLSAGAAHELGTPLGTIALVAKEMEKRLHALAPELGLQTVAEDAALVRSEVQRCRQILDRMAGRTGEPAGEAEAERPLSDLVAEASARLHPSAAARVESASLTDELLRVPPKAFVQVLENLLRNSLDASADATVEVRASSKEGPAGQRWVEVCVSDNGPGMSKELLARAGEPFFTTKDAGHGMGLGLYLARAVIEQLGGVFEMSSSPGAGTEVRLTLPQ